MTNKDRKTQTIERQNPTHPAPPMNLDVLYAFDANLNAFDLRWDDPSQMTAHNNWTILGVNIYRSTDSEFGPFYRINDEPIGATFYRDETTNEEVVDEDVSDRFLSFGGDDDESGRYIFRTKNYPIVRSDSEAVPSESPEDVVVKVDGVTVKPVAVHGETGEVQLRTTKHRDPATNELRDPVIPKPDSTVTCSYHYNVSQVKNELHHQVFYRITTVGYRDWDGVDADGDPIEAELRETPLEWTKAKTVNHLENMDYIWREAIRRNSWILDQGGERVYVFLRKWTGERCFTCWEQDYNQPRNDCDECYGTGIRDGYEGPYEVIVAPPDVERRINLEEHGFFIEESYEVWTGPSPMLSQRDFMVKQNNDRYSIGPVRMPTNRGNVLQQHFTVNHLDENDIRYDVPLNIGTLDYPQTRTSDWQDDVHREGENPPPVNNPQITDHEDVPDEIDQRGRTPTYDNINKRS